MGYHEVIAGLIGLCVVMLMWGTFFRPDPVIAAPVSFVLSMIVIQVGFSI